MSHQNNSNNSSDLKDQDTANADEVTTTNPIDEDEDIQEGPWPYYIMLSFSRAELSSENNYRGPWNKLLNTLFPPNLPFNFNVSFFPMKHSETIDVFTVDIEGSPVFFIGILPKDCLHDHLSRRDADAKMRTFFHDFSSDVQIPILHGVSAFGTKLAFYSFDKPSDKVELAQILSPSSGQIANAPEDWWSDDITELAGALKFQKIVEDAK